MSDAEPRLKGRAATVFDHYFNGRAHQLHPEDRMAAEAFWNLLGELDPPPSQQEPKIVHLPSRLKKFASIAAAVLIIMVGAWTAIPQKNVDLATYRNRPGETSTLTLSDGSSVRLGADSELQILYQPNIRRVMLNSGEAIFEVAKNPDRPFIVETRSGQMRALGTVFMVRLFASQARLTVIEGSVRLEPENPDATIAPISRIAKAGEQVEFGSKPHEGGQPRSSFVGNVEPADVGQAIGWTQGMLYFRGESLAEAVSVVNRYADRPLAEPNPDIANMPVYAIIRPGDTSVLAAIMAEPDRTTEDRD